MALIAHPEDYKTAPWPPGRRRQLGLVPAARPTADAGALGPNNARKRNAVRNLSQNSVKLEVNRLGQSAGAGLRVSTTQPIHRSSVRGKTYDSRLIRAAFPDNPHN